MFWLVSEDRDEVVDTEETEVELLAFLGSEDSDWVKEQDFYVIEGVRREFTVRERFLVEPPA